MSHELTSFVGIARDLEDAGLIWEPEIGDEVTDRKQHAMVSILVDPHGMSPGELRTVYLWLPTVEQLVVQFESRQAVLFHAGFELTSTEMYYKTVIQSAVGSIESRAASLRHSMGIALRDLLLASDPTNLH